MSIVFSRVRHRRIAYLGVVLAVIMVIFHGVGEVLQRVVNQDAVYRSYITDKQVDPVLPFVGGDEPR